jgi:acyl-coenzyme A thioesterase PaaI-like protein
MKITPKLLRLGLNIFGPYLGAGVKVECISEDWRKAKVSMKLRWYNRNIVGAHFGGSLYSMVDPHIMLMLMQVLGKDYYVWDKSAEIDFVKPGKGIVKADFNISDQDLAVIKSNTDGGKKYLHRFDVEIFDTQGDIVASVGKILYIKKKPRKQVVLNK